MDGEWMLVPGPEGEVAEALNCPQCAGGNSQINLGAVTVDHGTRRVMVDETGAHSAARAPKNGTTGPVVTVNAKCGKGHAFFLRFESRPDGMVFLATYRPK